MTMGLNILPSIWQSYTNAMLAIIAIINDLLMFTPSKKSHSKIRRLIKGIIKEQT